MTDPNVALQDMLRKFERRAPLEDSDRAALLALPYRVQEFEVNRYVVREGAPAENAALILSGFAFRHKLSVEGQRQILSVHIPGDFVNLDGALLATSDHNVQALTRCEMALVPKQKVVELILAHPRVGMAMWIDTLIDGSIFREWILNVGRRDARGRVAHLLCEIARRLDIAGLGSTEGYELPMTQEQLADATGLTSVHINRTLRALEQEGLLKRERRFVHIPDWERLRRAAEFNELYLHLDQVA